VRRLAQVVTTTRRRLDVRRSHSQTVEGRFFVARVMVRLPLPEGPSPQWADDDSWSSAERAISRAETELAPVPACRARPPVVRDYGSVLGDNLTSLTSVDDRTATGSREPTGVEELVVLLDEAGRAIGTADKYRVHHHCTPLHLAFSCYLFDASGALLITRRATGKKTWPGVWTNTCCGHPLPAEPLADAVRRRLAQELGLADVDGISLVLPGFRYHATMDDGTAENEVCPVFTARSAALPAPRSDEVGGLDRVPWPVFVASVLEAGRDVAPWCRLQVRELARLGPDPLAWPIADPAQLPPAAR
jgi:isopentenyl-diphosphate delta-isomerase